MIVVLFVVVATLVVVVIGLVAVGRETFTLREQPRQALFDLEEAVDYVAERLPDGVTAVLSYDDVRSILRWHIEYLRLEGVPDRRERGADEGETVVVEDDEGVAYVLGRADEVGLEVTDTEVVIVLEREQEYFRAIGAIGGEVG
jgi:hypothetical protein